MIFIFLSQGFLLGIAAGTTCLITCGPVYAPYIMLYGRDIRSGFLLLLEICGGRFCAYLAIGMLAGIAGKSLNFPGDKTWFTAIVYIVCSLYLLWTVFRAHRQKRCLQTTRWYSFAGRPFILGLITSINLCPSFLLAFAKAVELSGIYAGMALFAAFFAGTSLFLLPFSFFGIIGQPLVFRRIAQASAIAVAAWFIVQGVMAIYELV